MGETSKEKYHFINCQKIVVFNKEKTKVLLAKRSEEDYYNGVYTFIGGKMEITDLSLLEGLKREKNEEVGKQFKIRINPKIVHMVLFGELEGKKGVPMVLPHYYSEYLGGEIVPEIVEYSDFKWVSLDELDSFEPKIANIPETVTKLLKLRVVMDEKDFEEI